MNIVEFEKMVKEMFNAADANKDEVLKLDEFKQFSLFVLEALQGIPFANNT